MEIGSLSEMLSKYVGNIGINTADNSAAVNEVAADAADMVTDTDTYERTIEQNDQIIPCENYNDILTAMRQSVTETTNEQTTAKEEGTAVAGGGGGSSEESEDEQTTKIVEGADGVRYMETTITSGGITTVTRTEL